MSISDLLREGVAKYATQAPPAPMWADGWPEMPFEVFRPEQFPVDALPDQMADMVAALSTAHQAPADMVVAFALAVASAAIVGRVAIHPKANERGHYRESGQLFIFCEGLSGERKTPVLSFVKRPLEVFLQEQREETRRKNRHAVNKIEALKKQLNREKNPEKAATLADEIDELTDGLLPDPEMIMGDATAEGVAQAMSEHDGREIILDSEAHFLNVLIGKAYQREGGAVNIDAILKGYDDDTYSGNRIGRGSWNIPRASLSIGLGVQPKLLRRFVEDETSQDRGLQARGLFFRPDSLIGERTDEGGEIPDAVRQWWIQTVRRIACKVRENQEPFSMEFSAEAESAYRRFFREIESRLKSDLCGPMLAWACKLVGNTVRLAAILSLIDGKDEVTGQMWDAAETIVQKYLIPCARSLFGGEDPFISEDARKLLPYIRKLYEFPQSELWRNKGRYIFRQDQQAFESAVFSLRDRGYIREKQIEKEAKQGRPASKVWEVNPTIHRRITEDGQVVMTL